MKLPREQLEALSQRLREVSQAWRPEGEEDAKAVATAAGLLPRRRLHEWLGVTSPLKTEEPQGRAERTIWVPAMAMLMEGAIKAWSSGGGLVIWIGSAVWPYGASLPAAVIGDSVMVQTQSMADRVWAIDLALRSKAVTAVIADGSGLTLPATRRLQLAAEAGRALALLARPSHEMKQRSAAAYRWLVRHGRSAGEGGEGGQFSRDRPCWSVELLRGKEGRLMNGSVVEGATSGSERLNVTWPSQTARGLVEWHHGQGLISLPAVVGSTTATAQKQFA